MKVYDGAGLIADKSAPMSCRCGSTGWSSDAVHPAVARPGARRWFPKVTVTVLEPVKLVVDPELKGKRAAQAAGAALYGIMSTSCSAPPPPTAPWSRR
jgi:acyl-[acyl-carrier-protein]-phospholipid O-acyltransferase / long-chain-fatty-acid--[acyl-carrier-protein] ligase